MLPVNRCQARSRRANPNAVRVPIPRRQRLARRGDLTTDPRRGQCPVQANRSGPPHKPSRPAQEDFRTQDRTSPHTV